MSPLKALRLGRLLRILACALGILAALLVLAILFQLAVDGHPEGLLALVAGAAVPVVLWGAWRLTELVSIRLRSSEDVAIRAAEPRVLADQEMTARAELKVQLESTSPPPPPNSTILVRLGWT